jgi:ABC-type polysaccharide/polyol phosphate export permease
MAVMVNLSWTAVFLPLALVLALLFGLGIGFIVSVFNARYRDMQYLVGILLNVAFFTVPIVFTEDLLNRDEVPDLVRTLIVWNPPSLFVEIARDATYFLEVPQWNRVLAATAWGVITFSIGWVYFRDQSMAISEEP